MKSFVVTWIKGCVICSHTSGLVFTSSHPGRVTILIDAHCYGNHHKHRKRRSTASWVDRWINLKEQNNSQESLIKRMEIWREMAEISHRHCLPCLYTLLCPTTYFEQKLVRYHATLFSIDKKLPRSRSCIINSIVWGRIWLCIVTFSVTIFVCFWPSLRKFVPGTSRNVF